VWIGDMHVCCVLNTKLFKFPSSSSELMSMGIALKYDNNGNLSPDFAIGASGSHDAPARSGQCAAVVAVLSRCRKSKRAVIMRSNIRVCEGVGLWTQAGAGRRDSARYRDRAVGGGGEGGGGGGGGGDSGEEGGVEQGKGCGVCVFNTNGVCFWRGRRLRSVVVGGGRPIPHHPTLNLLSRAYWHVS